MSSSISHISSHRLTPIRFLKSHCEAQYGGSSYRVAKISFKHPCGIILGIFILYELNCNIGQFPFMKLNYISICVEATGAAPGSPTGDILDVGTPFYQDGQLQVHVYWQSIMGM